MNQVAFAELYASLVDGEAVSLFASETFDHGSLCRNARALSPVVVLAHPLGFVIDATEPQNARAIAAESAARMATDADVLVTGRRATVRTSRNALLIAEGATAASLPLLIALAREETRRPMTDLQTWIDDVRSELSAAEAVAICSAEGMILAVDADDSVDESVLGDVVSGAAGLTAVFGTAPRATAVVMAGNAAIAVHRLPNGSWASIRLSDPAQLGAALIALERLDGYSTKDGGRQ